MFRTRSDMKRGELNDGLRVSKGAEGATNVK